MHRGLVERARSQGADVIGFCPVTSVDRHSGGFTVTTPKGKIETRDVFIATNGYTPKAFPWQRRRVIPASAFMIATEILSPELMAKVLPGGRPLLENRNTRCGFAPTKMAPAFCSAAPRARTWDRSSPRHITSIRK